MLRKHVVLVDLLDWLGSKWGPVVVLILCGFVVYTTGRFVLWLYGLYYGALRVGSCLALYSLVFCQSFCSCGRLAWVRVCCVCVWGGGGEWAGLCASHAFVCLICTRYVLSFVSSSWCQRLSATCDCGTPWNFLLTIFVRVLFRASTIFPVEHQTL